ncbi:DUF2510 domain-containing protein [Kitasatospora sp. RB6PN24]|uniref:DUF2510 domain-containing protein n=1 Tax=Kitasatospora humi TaxID=2893891 RepID=UPI001E40F855|nr:DUF2510 domain-containing protein [Kitasatospora humi]MCC9308710.1 DUF2510 domain-containing protein [Kitasatospora humi]
MSTSTPPGWYPDPRATGHERYWDGRVWTEQGRPTAPAAGPVSDASPAYGHPAIPESLVLSEPPEPAGYAGPPPARTPGGAPLDPPRPKRTGLIIGIAAGGVLGLVLAGGLALTLSGGSVRSSAAAGAPAPVPGAARPTHQPDGVQPLAPPQSLPTSGTLQDRQHGWNVPLPQGWQPVGPDGGHTLALVTGRYDCGTPGGCVRGSFSIDADPTRGSDAKQVAQAAMASYVQQKYGSDDPDVQGGGAIIVAGRAGFAVRWHLTPQQGASVYLLLVAVPAADGEFTTMVGSVDDNSKAPDHSILDRIAAGITALVPPTGSAQPGA